MNLLEMPQRGKLTILKLNMDLHSKPALNCSDQAPLMMGLSEEDVPQKLLLKKVGAKLGHNTCNFVRTLKK